VGAVTKQEILPVDSSEDTISSLFSFLGKNLLYGKGEDIRMVVVIFLSRLPTTHALMLRVMFLSMF